MIIHLFPNPRSNISHTFELASIEIYLPLLEDESSEGFAVVVVVVTPVKEIVLVKIYFLLGFYQYIRNVHG